MKSGAFGKDAVDDKGDQATKNRQNGAHLRLDKATARENVRFYASQKMNTSIVYIHNLWASILAVSTCSNSQTALEWKKPDPSCLSTHFWLNKCFIRHKEGHREANATESLSCNFKL